MFSEPRVEALTVEQVAVHLGCSPRHAWSLVASGELRSFKSGRLRRVRPEALDAYMRGREQAEVKARLHLIAPRPYRRRAKGQ